MSKISEALTKLFKEHRIIFWYDEEANMTNEYNKLELGAIEKIKVENNHFQVKHQVIKESRKRRIKETRNPVTKETRNQGFEESRHRKIQEPIQESSNRGIEESINQILQ